MGKKILVIAASPRKGGNSEQLADAFIEGANKAGHATEKVVLYDKSIGFCRGCLACQKTGRCVIHDDAATIIEKMRTAEVIVFATPIYFYEMCGQMKTLLDRTNPLYGSQYAFRDIYLLASAADDEEHTPDAAQKGLLGWIACFEETHLAGLVFAGGVEGKDAIKGHAALEKARHMGEGV